MIDFQDDIEKCLNVLRKGGVILYPTDTIWGIGCDATSQPAVQRIFEIKKRREEKSLIVLVADEKGILKHTSAPDLRVFDYLKRMNRPTTVIYRGAIGLAPNLIQADGSIGIRLVRDPFCKSLVKRLRKPIVSTSANLAGEPSPRFFADISAAIKNQVDYIVEYRQNDASVHAPSSIIRWNEDGTATVLR